MKLLDCFQGKKKNVNFPSEMFGTKTFSKETAINQPKRIAAPLESTPPGWISETESGFTFTKAVVFSAKSERSRS